MTRLVLPMFQNCRAVMTGECAFWGLYMTGCNSDPCDFTARHFSTDTASGAHLCHCWKRWVVQTSLLPMTIASIAKCWTMRPSTLALQRNCYEASLKLIPGQYQRT